MRNDISAYDLFATDTSPEILVAFLRRPEQVLFTSNCPGSLAMKHAISLSLVLFATLLACTNKQVEHAEVPGALRVAVLPDQSRDTLLILYEPLLSYLRKETSIEFQLSVPEDYADLLEQFAAGEIDLAWFGGLTFTQAEQRSQAVPLVFRDIDLQFTSCYLAHASDTRETVRDFRGASFSFGPRLSTSGHLMPSYFLNNGDLDPHTFFASVRHSSGHDQTAKWVADGTVALGVANCIIVRSLLENGDLGNDDIRIIETTPPYSDYVWAVRESLDEDRRVKLLDAFLSLDASVPEHREILRQQGANAYLPAASQDFEIVRRAAKEADFLAEENGN